MTRKAYLAAVMRTYLAAPGSPKKASRSDWAIAATLLERDIPIERFAHAVRLASVRRFLSTRQDEPPAQEVRSLAYYRMALQRLSVAETNDGYVRYVDSKFQLFFG
jgi:hypothetical protein